jgi:hypothetical protein
MSFETPSLRRKHGGVAIDALSTLVRRLGMKRQDAPGPPQTPPRTAPLPPLPPPPQRRSLVPCLSAPARPPAAARLRLRPGLAAAAAARGAAAMRRRARARASANYIQLYCRSSSYA